MQSNYYFDKQKRQLIGGGFVELELECLMMAAMIGAWQRSWPHDWLTEATRLLLLLLAPCEAAHSCMMPPTSLAAAPRLGEQGDGKKEQLQRLLGSFLV